MVGHRGATAAFNRRELPAGTPNRVNIDHRRAISFAPGELSAYLRSTWDVTPEATLYIEAVHRLNNLGAVVTHVAHAISPEGFDAEWRVINLLTVEGDLISGCEVFDEADLDAALARFDELSRRRRGWRTRQAKYTNGSGRPSRHATGRLCGAVGRRHRHATIAVGS